MENEDTKVVAPETDTEDTGEEGDVVKLPKSEYEKLNQTLGSLKRELKDLKKPKEETPKESSKPDETLLQKAYLRAASITDEDEVELALETSQKWGVTVDKLVDDEDFKIKLEKLRTSKANQLATSGIRGDGAKTSAKNTPEYWIAKGTPPSKEDIPDSAVRRKINVAFLEAKKGNNGRKFYND